MLNDPLCFSNKRNDMNDVNERFSITHFRLLSFMERWCFIGLRIEPDRLWLSSLRGGHKYMKLNCAFLKLNKPFLLDYIVSVFPFSKVDPGQ